MKKVLRLVLLAFVFLGVPRLAAAQAGTITGGVRDTTGALPGVNVVLQGTAQGTTTDAGGRFTLQGVPAGERALVFSYIGYETQRRPVEVAPDQTTTLNVTLRASSTALQEVVVTGAYAEGQAKALNVEKMSPRIMDVLAADAIGKLPDRNAAEAVQRIAGVSIERDQGEGRFVVVRGAPLQWSSTLINGNRMPSSDYFEDRAVPLDLFPSELIAYVELSKALTPDQEADAIGGAVNFVLPTAPEARTLNLSLGGGFHNQSKSRIFNGSLVYGDRFLDDRLGVIVSGATWNRDWGSDFYEYDYWTDAFDQGDPRNLGLSGIDMRDYLGNRTTYGLYGGTEYQLGVAGKIFARGLFTRFFDVEQRRLLRFNYGLPADGGAAPPGSVSLRFATPEYLTQFFGGEVGGEHPLSARFGLDWKLAGYSNYKTYESPSTVSNAEEGYYELFFQQGGVQYAGLANDGLKYLALDAPPGYAAQGADDTRPQPRTAVSADSLLFDHAHTFNADNKNRDYTGELNLTYRPAPAWTVKVGGKYRNKYRSLVQRPGDWYPTAAETPTLSRFRLEDLPERGGFLEEIGGVDAGLFPGFPTKDQAAEVPGGALFPVRSTFNADRAAPGQATFNYDATEDQLAGYAMATVALTPRLTLIPGVRVENTATSYDSYQVDQADNVTPLTAESSFLAVLPMGHLKYQPRENWNVRAAVTRTFARPNFSDLSPARTIDYTSRTVSQGNTKLEPTYSINYDLLSRYFFQNIGFVSVAGFYKDISNVIYTQGGSLVLDGERFDVVQPQNVEEAWLAGVEVGLRRRLSFLPGVLSGLGVEGNYTYTGSSVQIPGRAEAQSLPEQADQLYNAALFYEQSGLSMRLAANYKGRYVTVVRAEAGPEHDRYYDSSLYVDFSGSYSLTPALRFFVELSNLTNQPLRYYHGDPDRPYFEEFYSFKGQIGLRYGVFGR